MSDIDFSIILTTYNRPDRLPQAIESVLNQTYQNFELIIMDDNSDNEEQKQVLLKYWNHPKVIIHKSDVEESKRSEIVRYSHLINTAFKFMNGRFVAYICDDDRYEVDRLQRFKDYFDQNASVFCIGGDQFCKIESNGVEENMPDPIRKQTRVLTNPNCCIDHTSFVHRVEVLQQVPQWSEKRDDWGSADGQFFEALGKAGYPMHPLGGHPTDTHVYHDGSWTKDAQWQNLGKKS